MASYSAINGDSFSFLSFQMRATFAELDFFNILIHSFFAFSRSNQWNAVAHTIASTLLSSNVVASALPETLEEEEDETKVMQKCYLVKVVLSLKSTSAAPLISLFGSTPITFRPRSTISSNMKNLTHLY